MSRRAGAELANAASVYNYFRDHDSVTGRYTQSDPIGLDGGINTYAYALGNPIRYFDPDGLEVRLICRNCARDKRRRLSGRLSNSTRRCSLRGRRIVILPGQYFDEETGLYYNYFRDYDAVTGRYVESDLIGLAGGLNSYVYAAGNPMLYIDPLGLRWVPCDDVSRGAQCWVPDPAVDNKPTCATAECAAGILPNRPVTVSVGVGGCLGTACVTYNTRNSAPNMLVPFPPDVGGSFSFCISDAPENSCSAGNGANQRSLNFGLGRHLGLSFGNDGSMCINIGAAIASPVETTVGTGKPLW